MTERFLPFDMARAICVVYIIGIWHLPSYLSPDYSFTGTTLIVMHRITEIVLGTFTFLSGYFLGKYQFSNRYDIKYFFENRFKRFYILLLIAALSYLLLKWISPIQLLQILTGTNLLFNMSAPTLWYFSMIILFYIITPILQYQYKMKNMREVIFCCLFICVFILSQELTIDSRLQLYLPCYYLGLITPVSFIQRLKKNNLILWSLGSLIVAVVVFQYVHIDFFKIIIVVAGIYLLLSSCMQLYHQKIKGLVSFLAMASMVAYLSHRQVFSVGKALCERLLGESYIPLFFSISLLALTFVISYYIQIVYNYISKHYIWKRK